ncbi:MAG: LigA [Candidatus Giovannonibacteria bacterium GW2011_GWC2_44_9]|uniref:LigA n=2 Tax=Candidatus Giovannoniibacteriota TaxID=1752738 RepID=A0A0G1IU26_9BACT|nr:MAG: LigA [Candidatus Giovannonibacteria bacterium GW2011_GWA1_44_29]KKT82921.1 MAG: LigA [Candidatus Giovannonibacteria bacterium GW2011_GWC2_44_9]KKT90815.1 MAG: LigA [Parcubacteria group bacterium GW2011_GWC1_45_13]
MISSHKETNSTVAILMSVRDEESYVDLNIQYHLDLGFDYIFIVNHCSTDNTNKILNLYKDNSRVVVIEEQDPIFDHAKVTNKLLDYANSNYKVDWLIFLDADEFLVIRDGNISDFIARLETNGIPYATIGWTNALFDHTLSDYTCSPVNVIDTMKYYYPWPEKEWQEFGHFRKALVKNHKHIEVVVGGHYIKTENNPEFFGEYNRNPFVIPEAEAKILHFEFRNNAAAVYEKWGKLASFERDSTSDSNAPWLERIRTIRKYVSDFKDNPNKISKRWFSEHRTFWGTIVPQDRIIYDSTLPLWYRKYFRRKIEAGGIKSICLVRNRNLGDAIMTEPVARFLSKYVDRICLATDIEGAGSILKIYDKVYKYSQITAGEIDCDIMIKLVYELSDNQKTYIQGYMESIGFGDVILNDIPILKSDWENIIDGEYILIAPFTSSWEGKKRSWGYKNFSELAKLLEKEYKSKCIILENHYSFKEMMSLIKHCKFFVGNDSAPGIIAQSFKKKVFIIFGATHPKYIHMSENAFPIYDQNRHKLCSHNTRQEEIDCCEEFCMERITVNEVFDRIKMNI